MEQEAELREAALSARADSPFRGQGSTRGRIGQNATERLCGLVHERFGIEITSRSMARILNRLGLEYRALNQGGVWREAGR